MADTLTTDVQLQQIKAPELTSARYGKDIREQFTNIDENFRQVSNADYIKGKTGASVMTESRALYDSENKMFTALGQAMVEIITDLSDIDWSIDWDSTSGDFTPVFYDEHQELSFVVVSEEGSTRVVHFFDYILENPNITVTYIPTDVENVDSPKYLISSPQVYTFLDMRYSNTKEMGAITGDNSNVFENLVDTSCLLSLTYIHEQESLGDPQFEKSNLFPTLYYDGTDGEFKWKIYGNETGIRAMGPAGISGTRAAVWIVKTNPIEVTGTEELSQTTSNANIPNPNVVEIVSYANISNNQMSWVDIDTSTSVPLKAGDACIVLTPVNYTTEPAEERPDVFDAFVSLVTTYEGDQKLYVTVNLQNAIGQNMSLNTLINELSNIKPNSQLGGLFVPFTEGYSGAHYLYNTSVDRNTLNIRPLQDNSQSVMRNPNSGVSDSAAINVEYEKVRIRGVGPRNTKGSVVVDACTNSGSIGIKGSIDLNCDELSIDHKNKITINSPKVIIGTTGVSGVVNTLNGNTNINGAATAKVNRVDNVELGLPIGSITMWAGPTAPDGWLLCDGSDISSRSDCADLNQVLGNIYNIDGDGISVVRLPNLQGRFPLGASTLAFGPNNYNINLGMYDGEAGHTLTAAEIKHSHGIYTTQGEQVIDSGGLEASATPPAIISGIAPHNNIPPYLAINFIIKYK